MTDRLEEIRAWVKRWYGTYPAITPGSATVSSVAAMLRDTLAELDATEARISNYERYVEREIEPKLLARLAACEKERDTLRVEAGRWATRHRQTDECLVRAEEALRQLCEAVGETFTENRDGGWKYRIEQAERLIALADDIARAYFAGEK